jgi:cysteinyl-tRNA synthetase
MDLVVPDTLTRGPRAVRARRGRPVTLYVCGPTVYDRAHVGHARTYLYFDLARRFLESEGAPVRHVMNFTDIEDKIDVRAAQLGIGWRELTVREERAFVKDLRSLGARLPHVRPRASQFVPAMAAVARALARTGRVERVGDEWYYTPPHRRAGTNFPTDTQLASHAVHEPGHPFPTSGDRAGAFMIWRLQRPPKPSWPGPWGPGIPGWHLECFVMAERFVGTPVDLHGGGLDLVFPHHYAENEVSLALRGHRIARTFLHTAFVLVAGDKMSKSTGNLVTLRSVLDRVEPSALRWYLLSKPLDRRLDWRPSDLERARREYERVRAAVRSFLRPGAGTGRAASAEALSEAVRRDLASGLATQRAFARLRTFAARSARGPRGRVARSDRTAARAAFRAIEDRTGLVLL